jgi:serine-type D-Ala-D-Ala carboxypeptidase/endopeptidase (penicillin-binding protein 4)
MEVGMSVSRNRLLVAGAVAALCTALAVAPGQAAAPPSAAARDAAPATLGARLDALLADPKFAGAEVGLTVRNVDTGQTLYDHSGALRVLPASNAKLYTSSAAMDILGPGFRFTTKVLETRSAHGHVLTGDLFLKGYGDPMMMRADYNRLAARIAKSGVRTVRGSLVADDTYYDSVRLAPFWSWDDEPYYYSAQTSALNVSPDDIGDTGTVLANVTPGRSVGGTPQVSMIPANHYLHVHNTATTGAAGSDETIDVVREHGRNVLDVTGSIPLGADSYAAQPAVDEPTHLVAELFRTALARHGVQVQGGTAYRATPDDARLVTMHRSATLSALLIPFLKLSNNMMAEALTKAIGQAASGEGSWSAGAAAILADVATNGVDTSTLQLFDGSGLGRADYVTTDQTSALLAALRAKPWFQTWYDALPIAGEPDQLVGGTLRHRMAGTPQCPLPCTTSACRCGGSSNWSAPGRTVADPARDCLIIAESRPDPTKSRR